MKNKIFLLVPALALATLALTSYTPAKSYIPIPVNKPVESHFVGELYGGGIVFFVSENKEHGLVASLKNAGKFTAWSNPEIKETDTTSDTDGASNTSLIVKAGIVTPYAAALCDAYEEGAFSDWYLPASEELQKLMDASGQLNKILEANTAAEILPLDFYWSSTEVSGFAASAKGYDLRKNKPMSSMKNRKGVVRAIRAF